MTQQLWTLASGGATRPGAIGTCEIAQTYGVVMSASIKREFDTVEVKTCDNDLLGLLMTNPRYVMSMKVITPVTMVLPADTATITLPTAVGAGLTAKILSWQIDWTQGDVRQLSIEATRWDSLSSHSAATY